MRELQIIRARSVAAPSHAHTLLEIEGGSIPVLAPALLSGEVQASEFSSEIK